MKIAISGATGFIGRHFKSHVTSCGHVALALTRTELQSCTPAVLQGVDAMVHLAGRAHVLSEDASDPAEAFTAVNVRLTESLLKASIKAGVGRFVLMSSAGVLGNSSSDSGVDDQSSPRPYDHYSRSKLEAEKVVNSIAQGRIEYAIIRPPVVYGPGARGNFARIVRAVSSGLPLPVGALDARRSMLGLRNLCNFIMRVVEDTRVSGTSLLVSDVEVTSVHELTRMIGYAMGRCPTIISVPVPILSLALRLIGMGSDVPRLTKPCIVHATRARELLQWTPPYSMSEELAWTVAAGKGDIAPC
jgi:nucleoside-diphosphate-sugar epimerase